jgi:hypothetical protein
MNSRERVREDIGNGTFVYEAPRLIQGIPMPVSRSDATLLGGFLQQSPGGEGITPATAPVHHHLRERYLRFSHTCSRCSGDPSAAFSGVHLHSTPIDQHPSIPILRVHDTIRGSAHPLGGQALVTFHPHSLRQADSKIESRGKVA